MNRLSMICIALIVASALSLVSAQYRARQLFIDLESAKAVAHKLPELRRLHSLISDTRRIPDEEPLFIRSRTLVLCNARHHAHIYGHIRRIRKFHANVGNRRSDGAHGKWHDVHGATLHATIE